MSNAHAERCAAIVEPHVDNREFWECVRVQSKQFATLAPLLLWIYSGALEGAFISDDYGYIVDDSTGRSIWETLSCFSISSSSAEVLQAAGRPPMPTTTAG